MSSNSLLRSIAAPTLVILVAVSTTRSGSAAFPGANGRIAFNSATNDIFTMDADGSHVTQLTFTPGLNEIQPAVSPDGTKIAFIRETALWVMDVDGSNQVLLTNVDTSQNPTWSPDGRQIAFETNRTHLTMSIWVMNADGSNQHSVIDRLLDTNVVDPAWSPDGTKLAYVRANPCSSIAVASAIDGSGETRVVTQCDTFYPSWSPDGRKLAYQRLNRLTAATDLYVMDLATGIETNLTGDGTVSNEHFPAWSPDGTQIAFSILDGQWRIYRMNADGSGKVAVGPGHQPDWAVGAAPPDDTTPPVVTCGSADGLWHAADVSIPCAAADSDSGLADPDDASFMLSTQVPAGFFDPNAPTGSRQVCDGVGNCTTAGPIAGNKVDRKVPSIAASIDPPPNAQGWHNTDVTVRFDAADGGSGVNSVTAPLVISTEGAGQTVLGTAVDNVGNAAAVSAVLNIDKTAPALTLPALIQVNAVSPAGAPVSYAVTAHDALDPAPAVQCIPSAGSTFAIGDSIVRCTAADTAANQATGQFTIHVKGVVEQLRDLLVAIVNDSRLTAPLKAALAAKITAILDTVTLASPSQRRAVCDGLALFIATVRSQAGRSIPVAVADRLISDALRIRAVIGC